MGSLGGDWGDGKSVGSFTFYFAELCNFTPDIFEQMEVCPHLTELDLTMVQTS
jgi:hypothetical protein